MIKRPVQARAIGFSMFLKCCEVIGDSEVDAFLWWVRHRRARENWRDVGRDVLKSLPGQWLM